MRLVLLALLALLYVRAAPRPSKVRVFLPGQVGALLPHNITLLRAETPTGALPDSIAPLFPDKVAAPFPDKITPLCTCPPGLRPLSPDGCYHLVADGSFESVQVACRSLGGRLLSVTGPKEDAKARSVMASHRRAMAWIGLRDESSWDDPEWRWSDGSAFNFSDWHREPGKGRCVVSWLHGGWQRRDCRLSAPGICYRSRTAPQPCAPPPAQLPHDQSPLPGGGDKWKLSPPPLETPLAQLQWPPQWVHQRFVLRDAPAQWHQWI